MNVEILIVALLLLGLAALTIPWLVRLSLSSRSFQKYSRSILLRKAKFARARNNPRPRAQSIEAATATNGTNTPSESEQNSKTFSISRQLQVRYLSSMKSHSPLRLVPWDARGILTETEKGFVFRGNDVAGASVDIEFPSDEVQINYQKGSLLWDGGFSWCVIERDGEKHFFTSDVEPENSKTSLDSGQEQMTATGIYQTITKRYI